MSYDQLLKRAMEDVKKTDKKVRFEIPELIIKKRGKKTVIRNFSEICKKIRRNKKDVSKFIFKELAVSGEVNKKELILNSSFNQNRIKGALEKYLKQRVICNKCGKYDSEIKKKDSKTYLKCESCGAEKPLD